MKWYYWHPTFFWFQEFREPPFALLQWTPEINNTGRSLILLHFIQRTTRSLDAKTVRHSCVRVAGKLIRRCSVLRTTRLYLSKPLIKRQLKFTALSAVSATLAKLRNYMIQLAELWVNALLACVNQETVNHLSTCLSITESSIPWREESPYSSELYNLGTITTICTSHLQHPTEQT